MTNICVIHDTFIVPLNSLLYKVSENFHHGVHQRRDFGSLLIHIMLIILVDFLKLLLTKVLTYSPFNQFFKNHSYDVEAICFHIRCLGAGLDSSAESCCCVDVTMLLGSIAGAH